MSPYGVIRSQGVDVSSICSQFWIPIVILYPVSYLYEVILLQITYKGGP